MIRRLLLALLFFSSGGAMKARAASAPATSFTTTLVSNYLFRGQRLGGLSLQPAAEVAMGDTRAGLIANFPISEKVVNQSDPEFDFYASHGIALPGQFRLTPGLTIYAFPNAPTAEGYFRSIIEPSLTLSCVVAGVQLSSTYSFDASRKGPVFEMGATAAVPLKQLGTELDLALGVGGYDLRDTSHSSADKRQTWGTYASCSATIPYQVSLHSRFTVGFTYTASFNAYTKTGLSRRVTNPLATSRGSLALGYSYAF